MISRLKNNISGRVWKFGDSIDTNQLAGTANAQNMEDYKKDCLAALNPEFPKLVKSGDIIVAGDNFGSGSSRQSAVEVLFYIGIKAVLVESVARIYFRTCMALAFPLIIAPGISDIVEEGEELGINYSEGIVSNLKNGEKIKIKKYAPSIERIFDSGGLVRLMLKRLKEEGF